MGITFISYIPPPPVATPLEPTPHTLSVSAVSLTEQDELMNNCLHLRILLRVCLITYHAINETDWWLMSNGGFRRVLLACTSRFMELVQIYIFTNFIMDFMDSLAKCCRFQQSLWSLTFAMIDHFFSQNCYRLEARSFPRIVLHARTTPHTRASLVLFYYFVLVICPQPSTGYNYVDTFALLIRARWGITTFEHANSYSYFFLSVYPKISAEH